MRRIVTFHVINEGQKRGMQELLQHFFAVSRCKLGRVDYVMDLSVDYGPVM